MRWMSCVLGVFAVLPAWGASWSLVTSTDGTSHYLDAKTLRKTADVRRVWELSSRQQVSPGGVGSQRLLVEYDCRAKRYRLLQLEAFAGPMATGMVVGSVDHAAGGAQWHDVAVGSVAQAVLAEVCAL